MTIDRILVPLALVEGLDPVPVPGVTLRPSGPLRMRLEPAR
jgi:hypothetical protein